MHPRAAQTAQSRLPPLAACFAITAGARREMGEGGGGVSDERCWGRGDGDKDGDRCSLPAPASCIPKQLWAELGGSSRPQRAREPCWGTVPRDRARVPGPGTVPGDRAKVPCPGTVPGDGGFCISAEPMLEARFALLHHHCPTKTQLPLDWNRAVTILGCQQPPWPVSGGGSHPHKPLCFSPHPPRKPNRGSVPSGPSAGGTGTCGLCLTKAEQRFVLSHLPAAS